MNTLTASTPTSVWTGRALSVIVFVVLLADAVVNLAAPGVIAAEMAATGFAKELAAPLGVIILVCAIAYAVPATSVVGAILITAFAGGAISVHFRMAELGSAPQVISALIAVFAWVGLLLRYPALRAFLPWVRADAGRSSSPK